MRKTLAVTAIVLIGCGALALRTSTHAAAANQTKAAATPTAAAKPEDLDRLLAPVALYPDALLAQMLLCTGDPLQVTRLAKWMGVNKLTGTDLQDAATTDGFDPSFVALVLFPQVVSYMAQNIDWTTQLGKTFSANKTAVFDSIQRLRAQARASGALKDTAQQNVETKTTSSGQQVIVIEPANPQIIYVPQYNPTVVYTQPPTQTVVVKEDDHTDAALAGVIGFTAGIAIGAAFDNDYYYGPYGWHGGGYMYNDAWDDYYDAREDAREDWQDHREDLVEERGDRANNAQEQRTERTENRQENRPETQTRTGAATRESRGYSDAGQQVNRDRSGTTSDAFSGYSSGRSEHAASSRGQRSRSSSSRSGGRRR
jgi:hypothetical protein